jgi:hypothetical protein
LHTPFLHTWPGGQTMPAHGSVLHTPFGSDNEEASTCLMPRKTSTPPKAVTASPWSIWRRDELLARALVNVSNREESMFTPYILIYILICERMLASTPLAFSLTCILIAKNGQT